MVLRSRSVQPTPSGGVITSVYGDAMVDPDSAAWAGAGINAIGQGLSPTNGVQVMAALQPALTQLTPAIQELSNTLRQQAVAQEKEARYSTSTATSGGRAAGLQDAQQMFHQAAAIGAATAVQMAQQRGSILGEHPPPPFTPIVPIDQISGRVMAPTLDEYLANRSLRGQHTTMGPIPGSRGALMQDPALNPPVAGGQSGFLPQGKPEPPPLSGLPTSFSEGKSFSLSDLRHGVASRINRWASEKAPAYSPPVMGPDGNWYKGGAPLTVSPIGQIEAEPLTPMQRSIGDMRAAVSERGRNFLGAMAEGGGPGEALNAAAPMVGKIAGGVGLAYAAVNHGLDQLENQRRANQRFQAVLGGSNAEGFTERAQQNIFRLGLRGTMGGADAEALYQGAMDLAGGHGGRRTAIEGIGTNLYRDLGMSVQDTLGILRQAVKGGNDSLYALAETLRDVTVKARAAGENAAEAREHFERAYASTSSVFRGTSAADLASQQVETLAPLGAQAGDVSFDTSQGTIFQQAQAMGMTPNQYLAGVAAPTGVSAAGAPQGANLASVAQYSLVKRYLSPLLSGGARARIAAFQQAHAGKRVGKSAVQTLVSELMQNNEIPQYPAVLASLRAAGVTFNNTDAMSALIDVFTIFFQDPQESPEFTQQQKDAQEMGHPLDLGLTDAQRSLITGTAPPPGTVDPKIEAAKGQAAPGAITEMAKRIGISDAEDIKTMGDVIQRTTSKNRGDDDHKGVQDDLLQAEITNNSPSRVLELLVSKAHDSDHRFLVTDPDGNQVQVNEHGLITQFFNQAESDPSSIQVIAGEGAGGSLADIIGSGMSGYTNPSRMSAAEAEVGIGGGTVGTGFAQEDKGTGVMKAPSQEEQDKAATKAGAFEIRLAPETQQYFRLVKINSDPNAAARSAGVPSNTTPNTHDLPSGN